MNYVEAIFIFSGLKRDKKANLAPPQQDYLSCLLHVCAANVSRWYLSSSMQVVSEL